MKILILHAVPYQKIDYHLGIDHELHDVTYIGKQEKIQQIPDYLRCKKIVRPGIQCVADEVLERVSVADRFEMVISLSEFELLEAATVREQLAIAGPRYNDLLHVRDKIIMKKVAEQAGIRIPKHLKVSEVLEVIRTASNSNDPLALSRLRSLIPWNGKIVLKPIMGASSEGISVHDGVAELAETLIRGSAQGESFDEYELEEFIAGSILHVDGIVEEGESRVMICSRYIGTCLDYAKGKPLASIQVPISEEYMKWFKRCLQGLKIEHGSFHLEVIETESGLVFLEIANRVGGADIISATTLKTGIHLPSVELQVLLRAQQRNLAGNSYVEPMPALDHINNHAPWYGWFVFPGHLLSSRTCQVKTPDWFRSSPNIVKYTAIKPDQEMPERITYQDWEVPVAGILTGRDEAELEDTVHRIFDEVEIHVA